MNFIERYVKENNMQGYLNYRIDGEKLKEYIRLYELEDMEEDETLEDFIINKICDYNYKLNTKEI